MTHTPKISVLLPVYNAEKFLHEAIDSLLRQTFCDFEVICINDGSTDDTLKILDNYANNDSRIKVFSKKNAGILSKTLNFGLKRCSANAQYIARMDADDICLPNRFKEQYEFMESNPDVDICGTSMIVFNENPKISKEYIGAQPEFPSLYNIFNQKDLMHPTVFFRAKFIHKNNILYDTSSKADDKELWMRCTVVYNAKIQNIKKPLIKYRLRESSLSNNNQNKKLLKEGIIKFRVKYLTMLKEKNKSDFDTVISKFTNDFIENSCKYRIKLRKYKIINCATFYLIKRFKCRENSYQIIYNDLCTEFKILKTIT